MQNTNQSTKWKIFISPIKYLIIITLLLTNCNIQKRKSANIKAFAKLYGYVRWFHPSDEAQQIDWDKLAVTGARKVENAPNVKALRDSLLLIFRPIAPTLKIYLNNENIKFNIAEITPKDTIGYKVIAWQHLGVELQATYYPGYQSSRTNRLVSRSENKMPQVYRQLDSKELNYKNIRMKISIKGTENDSIGLFLLPMRNKYDLENIPTSIKPVYFKCHNEWRSQEVKAYIYSEELVIFGVVYNGDKTILIDNFEIEMEDKGSWKKIELDNMDLNSVIEDGPVGFYCFSDKFYKVGSLLIDSKDYCLKIEKNDEIKLFDKCPQFGEILEKKISDKLSIQLPIALLGNNIQTFPAADKLKLKEMKQELNTNESEIYEHLGALIITRNIFQHFYPYFDVIKVDWEKEFEKAIEDAYNDETNHDFLNTLRKFTAKLKDGHIFINHSSDEWFCLPIAWEWVEDKLIITKVLDNESGLKVGDIVNSIDDISSKDYFMDKQKYISAATPGYLNYLSQRNTIHGKQNTFCSISITDLLGNKKVVKLKHSLWISDYYQKFVNSAKFKLLKNNNIYINLDQISMDEIDSLLPKIIRANGLICDLRGYPCNGLSPFLSNLLSVHDTCKWLCTPQIIYPDHEKMQFKNWEGWGLKPKEPHINEPVVFITDGRAISYAESIMGIVKHYKLATIVGQPTAGTNGNVNTFDLPGGYKINFTGMKVTKLDGSQHHGIGVLPDIYVEKTIKGVIEGRDEFLEKAIEVVNKMKHEHN